MRRASAARAEPAGQNSLTCSRPSRAREGRAHVFAEHARDGILQETEFMTMVRSREWKLVHFLGESAGQLFDLIHDPGEIHNLWDDPAHADRKRELLDVLREWRIRSAYHTANWGAEWR